MSRVFKASLLITIFFGINKLVALLRQVIIAKQFGLNAEIDAFNTANNIPDLLFSLISGGALALAFIPIFTEYIDQKGLKKAWHLFSQVANIIFVCTALLSIVVWIFADAIVHSNFGVAPGFTLAQQQLTTDLMRLNLLATLLFSLSGLVMAALQSNKHFLLPAIAPILYNVGQIIGAVLFVPYFDLGVYGLAYGVILGALLHLLIQVPVLFRYQFSWTPTINFNDPGVKRVFALMGPRILTVLFIQIMFITRDNLASRLHEGAITALTYGYFFMQVPETLIGTAIGTALLPTLSELAHRKNHAVFIETLNRTFNVIVAITVIITALSFVSLEYVIKLFFHFSAENTQLLVWVTNAYMLGLVTQCLLEIVTRAFYARQDARTPLIVTFSRLILFITLAIFFLQKLGAVGLALMDTVTVTFEVAVLLYLLMRASPHFFSFKETFIRTTLGSIASILSFLGILYLFNQPTIWVVTGGLFVSGIVGITFIKKELKLLLRL